MNLQDVLGKMEEFVEARKTVINETYKNITNEADNGNKEAETVLNYGNEKEIKDMINVALNK